MSAIYSTLVPSGSGEPNTDLDATQPAFDVYQTYQRALTDEEVSLRALLLLMVPCSSSHPRIQISPPLAAILSLTELVTRSDGEAGHRSSFMTPNTLR